MLNSDNPLEHAAANAIATALTPAAKRIGGTLEAIVEVALLSLDVPLIPLTEFSAYAKTRTREKFSRWRTPPEAIVEPEPTIAAEVLLRVCTGGRGNPLHDLYMTLLARSMDREHPELIHPAFVGVLSQLSQAEVRALPALRTERGAIPLVRVERHMTNGGWHTVAKHLNVALEGVALEPELPRAAIDNFVRLGLLAIHEGQWLTGEPRYDRIKQLPSTTTLFNGVLGEPGQPRYIDYLAEVTEFGRQFVRALNEEER